MAIFKNFSNKNKTDRSAGDRKRHKDLIEDSIKKNIGDIIAEESIIGQSKYKKIKIPVRSIKEYQFIYGDNKGGTATGDGTEKEGQVVGDRGEKKPGSGQQAGDEAGEEIIETEITIEELINYLFEDLNLPDLERKKYAIIDSEHEFKRSGYQLKGIPPRLAKKQTVLEKKKREQTLKRNKTEEEKEEINVCFNEDDLRFYRKKPDIKQHSNAVVICIMDVSGSMDTNKKYLARSFYFLLYQFAKYKYENVEVVFIAHTTEAKEVNEYEFFHRGESGGTMISSGYEKALEIIEERYNPTLWNIYTFHCSDGDNWTSDNDKSLKFAQQLCEISNLFGYTEIVDASYSYYSHISTMSKFFEENLNDENFISTLIKQKEDVWNAFKNILNKEPEKKVDENA